jgi:putative SOS response-associated peptidase YedK
MRIIVGKTVVEGNGMCGRFTLHSRMNLILQQFAVEMAEFSFEPRYNIAPTQSVPIIRNQKGIRSISLLRWGLVPKWAKDISIGSRMINARAETLSEKPSFRSAFKRRRCLVPADGYYEWLKEGKNKIPFLIQTSDDAPFVMAGLWESWQSNESDSNPIETFTVITTTANEATSGVHDRMPVILDTERQATWLDEDCDDVTALQPMLQPYDSERISVRPVSTYVNSVKHDDPRCIESEQRLF